MKHSITRFPVFLFSCFLVFTFSAFATNDEIPVTAPISAVTVFLNGAQIKHDVSTTINQGTSYLKVENLPLAIDKNSIQVKGGGSFTILSVTQQVNYLMNQEKPKEIAQLEDSVKALQHHIHYEKNFQQVLAEEETLLYANKSIGNKDAGVDALDLEEMANFFRKRLTDIRTKGIDSREKEKKLNEISEKLSNQLGEKNAKRNKAVSEVIVGVSAKAKINAKLQLSYFVYGAGWTPLYDIRSTGEKNISLAYKANVFQNTGVDWNKVTITLSTGNPVQSGTKPELIPWTLRFQQPVVYYDSYKKQAMKGDGMAQQLQMPAAAMSEQYDLAIKEEPAKNVSSYTQMTESQVATEFVIGIPYTIPSDGKKYVVEIQNNNLKGNYTWYSAPKIDKDAFLLAKITGWEDMNLLPGEANIFNEETYIGRSFLNTATTNDTLDISFGRDKSVVIKRTLLKDYTTRKIIGANKTEIRTWEIEVRNTKKDSINLVLDDQIPLSSDKEITVENVDKGGAQFDETSGRLRWDLIVAPAESKKVRFIYSVRYPKDRYIPNL